MITRKHPEKKFFFVGEFEIECDKKERKCKKMTWNWVVYKEAKSEKNECSVHRMTNESVRTIRDKSCIVVWLRNNTERTFTK